jgi:uncharacterized protein involved in type VI secretion and phage assembly
MTTVARSRTTDRRYYGVVEALVTAVEDDQGKEGRVKLKFPWFDDRMETEWCRVRQFYAGNGYGAFFVPEVGDEVLVAFIHGDMRLPVVLGGLYNGADKPPTHRARDRDQKLIRTRAGHEVLLDDTSGKERVRITTKAGHSADLSDQDKKIAVQTSGGHSLTLDDQGQQVSLKTSGGQSVVLNDQSGSVTIQTSGGQSITLQAGTATITATSVVLSGTSIKLGGDAATQSLVLGELLMAAYNAHTHTCTAPGFPSGPPLIPLTAAQLSQVSKTS